MVANTKIQAVPASGVPYPPIAAATHMPETNAATADLCPTCGARLRYINALGVCRSAKCLWRVVLTGGDV